MKKSSLLILLFLTGCTPTPSQVNLRWSGSGPQPELQKFTDKSTFQNHLSQNEEILIYQQKIAGFKLDGTFVKVIKGKDQKTIFQSASLVQGVSPLTLLKAFRLDKNKQKIWARFLESHPQMAQEKKIESLEVVLGSYPNVEPVVKVLLEGQKGYFHALQINEDADLEADIVVGSQLTDLVESMSTAFPRGPKKSSLSAVVLNRRSQAELLSDSNLEILSSSPTKINLTEPLEFSTADDRFDQIQAFYYSQQIINWFKTDLKQDFLGKIRITTQLGFPDKTNAAFYFQNQIRLGQGDNEIYSHIAWDPSIVMHETSHALIDAISHLPFQGEGGSINEGYADMFTTFFLDSPYLGENSYLLGPYKRSVDQALKLSEKNNGLYHDSAIVSGFFWSLKKQIGSEKTLELAIKILNRLGPNSNFQDFKTTLNEQMNILNETQFKQAQQLMKERELL